MLIIITGGFDNVTSSGSIYIYAVKNVVYYMALRSVNHIVIRVVNTTQCHIIHQLVWYALQCIYIH